MTRGGPPLARTTASLNSGTSQWSRSNTISFPSGDQLGLPSWLQFVGKVSCRACEPSAFSTQIDARHPLHRPPELKAIRFPSGEKLGSAWGTIVDVSRRKLPPADETTYRFVIGWPQWL